MKAMTMLPCDIDPAGRSTLPPHGRGGRGGLASSVGVVDLHRDVAIAAADYVFVDTPVERK